MKKELYAWLTLLATLLGGCAQIDWGRGSYESMRHSAERDARQAGPAALPDPQMPRYEVYEEERRRLRGAE